MDGVLGPLVSWGMGAAVVAAVARPYLFPKPSIHHPSTLPGWSLFPRDGGDGDNSGDEVLRCCQINIWSGSTYELEPEGASTAYQLFYGRFGAFEQPGQRKARRDALVSELRRMRPALVTINEAASKGWVCTLADELGLCAIWHSGVAVVRLGPLALPPAIQEGDAILFHPDLKCEHVARQRLSGSVWGERVAFNFGDATQAVAALLRTPAGKRLYVVGTHWQASLIEDDACKSELSQLAARAAAPVHAQSTSTEDSELQQDRVLREGHRLMKEGTAMRLQEAEGVLRLLSSDAAQRADGRLVMGDLNTTPATPEMAMLLERGRLVDAWSEGGSGAGGETWVPENPNVAMQIAEARRLEPGVVHSGGPVLPWEAATEAGTLEAVAAEVKSLSMQAMEARAQRLDYILFSCGEEETNRWNVERCSLVMTGDDTVETDEPAEAHNRSKLARALSDHYGVVADIRLHSRM